MTSHLHSLALSYMTSDVRDGEVLRRCHHCACYLRNVACSHVSWEYLALTLHNLMSNNELHVLAKLGVC